MRESRKGESFWKYKQKMKLEPHLETLNRKLRVVITKFRTSDHKLMIEEARKYRPKPPPEQRTCKICTTQMEDEHHFLLDCTLYGSRNLLFRSVANKFPEFNTLNNQQKFVYLMSQEDPEVTAELANKVQEWFDLRTLILTNFFQP